VEAVSALGTLSGARPALLQALDHPDGPVRLEALQALVRRGDPADLPIFAGVLRTDPAPLVRHRALEALDAAGPPHRWEIGAAFNDPIWRVRLNAIARSAAWIRADRAALAELRRRVPGGLAAEGALGFLRVLLGEPPPSPKPRPEPPVRSAPWWDPDPAVLRERLRHLSEADWRASLEHLPALLELQDGYPLADTLEDIRRRAAEAWLAWGTPALDRSLRVLLAEPRRPFTVAWAWTILERLPPPRRAALDVSGPRPGRQSHGAPFFSRGARRRGARGVQRFLAGEDLRARAREPALPRALVPGGEPISPLVISGRHQLPARGYAEALDAGCNALFWEPDYAVLTAFLQQRPRGACVISGTFAARPRAVRRDLEQALRLTRHERLLAFLVFWVRSSERLSDDVAEVLLRARERGEIAHFGISTHHRQIALAAMGAGWELIMVRHSAAHRGAEAQVLPVAEARGVGVLGFSALCYGRMLSPDHAIGGRRVTAPDAYRYSLAQPGMRAVISAPRTLGQLRENLAVLHEPDGVDLAHLREARLREARLREARLREARLREVGDQVYARSRAFLELVRWR